MTARFNVVLTGDVLPEYTRDTAVQSLAALMNVPAERAARLLAGRATVVRRDLPEARVTTYLAALRQAGAAARAEAAAPLGPPQPRAATERPVPVLAEAVPACCGPATQLPAMGDHAARVANEAPPAVADAPHALRPPVAEPERRPATGARDASQPGLGLMADAVMSCPACGAQQAKRTLCRACGVDMPRVRAAQLEAGEAPAVPSAPPAGAMRHGATAREATAGAEGPHETPHPLGLSLHGRVGRLRYLAYAFPAYVPLVAGLALGALIGGAGQSGAGFLIPFGLGALITVWLAIRVMVLRLHDLDRSGKWVLAMMVVPAVAGFTQSPAAAVATAVILVVTTLLLVLVPGSRGSNAYGVPPGPNTAWTIAGAVMAVVLGVLAGVADAGESWSDVEPDDTERAVDMRWQS